MQERAGSNVVGQVSLWLAVIGAVNWGLVGLFDFDLVRAIFGTDSQTPASGASRVVYALVGIAGVALAIVGPRLRDAGRVRAPLGTGSEVEQRA
ncbi:MAG: DUF378 domain-containing protein [Anaeromyxobacteraceae bacterium]